MKKTPVIASNTAVVAGVVCLALLAAGAAALWWPREEPRPENAGSTKPKSGIVTVAEDSRPILPSYSSAGDVRRPPVDADLEQALSPASRLGYAQRLQAVHARYGAVLTDAQSDFLRAFVADPALPEGLDIRQVRALKNDVLNLLCAQPGGEAATATAAVLRTLFADEKQDAGLRDYALQHLVDLIEREPAIGWQTHWAALEGPNGNLAATALLHLAGRLSAGGLAAEEHRRVESAALRIAADLSAGEPARTTALQICGRLKLAAACPLANEIARSTHAGIPLRIAATAALGDLGPADPATRNFLEQTASGPEKRLRLPAANALARLDSITTMKKTTSALRSGAITSAANGL